jgi:hypothetical protein
MSGRNLFFCGHVAGRRPGPEWTASEALAVMGIEPVREVWTLGNDAGRIDVGMDFVIVALDVIEVDGVAETGCLEEVARIRPEHGHLRELLTVALEVPVINGIETYKSAEEAYVDFGDRVADEVTLVAETVTQLIESREENVIGPLVGILITRESALVNTVVDVVEDVADEAADLCSMGDRVKIGSTASMKRTPLRREVKRNLGEIVGDDLTGRDIDYRRNRDSAWVLGIVSEVGICDTGDTKDRVDAIRIKIECPTPLVVSRAAHTHRKHRLQTEESADDDGPVRPRTRTADDEAISACDNRESLGTISSDSRGEVVGIPLESACLDVTALFGLILHGPIFVAGFGGCLQIRWLGFDIQSISRGNHVICSC